ncbi:MAG: hypothetical protein V4629_06390 [Pseudomonadota bacterium]
MNEIDIELVKALINLSPKTTREVADLIEMKQPNMMSALAGTRPLPKNKVAPLLELLGIPNGEPSFTKVHFWVAGVDLSPLQYAISKFFPVGALIGGLWRQGGGIWDMTRALDQQIFVIYDERCRVVVKRTGLGTFMPTAKPIGPENIHGLKWRGKKIGAETMISIPAEKYQQWSHGDDINLEDLLKVLGADSGIGWREVVQMMIDLGITPSGAMGIIQSWREAQQ